MKWTQLAPAGTRIPPSVTWRWIGDLLAGRGDTGEFEAHLADWAGVDVAVAGSSGRALMAALLQVLSSLRPAANEVIIPGYTCPSVAGSVVAAGLRIRPVDVNPSTLDYDEEALEGAIGDRTLALVSGNLFGLPNDLPRLEALARSRGIFMVDDAAQALGATVDGRKAGTFGDAGLFSLDKGKVITTMQGGVAVTRREEVGQGMRRLLGAAPEPGRTESMASAARVLGYVLFLRPTLYRLPASLLPLGRTPWDADPRLAPHSPQLAPLASRLLDRLEDLNEGRRQVARRLLAALHASGGEGRIRPIVPGAGERAVTVPIRLPLLVEDSDLRDRLIRDFQRFRLGASTMYPRAIMDIPDARPHLAPHGGDTPGARRVANQLLTLPTHGWVSTRDLVQLEQVLGASREPSARK